MWSHYMETNKQSMEILILFSLFWKVEIRWKRRSCSMNDWKELLFIKSSRGVPVRFGFHVLGHVALRCPGCFKRLKVTTCLKQLHKLFSAMGEAPLEFELSGWTKIRESFQNRNNDSNWYGWWKKSCTSWYVVYPIIYMYLQGLYIPGGAGFLPSTIWLNLVQLWCSNVIYRVIETLVH